MRFTAERPGAAPGLVDGRGEEKSAVNQRVVARGAGVGALAALVMLGVGFAQTTVDTELLPDEELA